ncbi:NlpC/P60 family protein [Dactylosporangium sp. NPDC005555]|uniref:C40 family peptidase n=1 Tax=Dactylosporangium sp. NPDC005555 TaxID=3154889 RepID=UPI00339F8476
MSVGHRARRSLLRTLIIGAVSLVIVAPASVAKADPTLAEIEAQLDKVGDEFEATVEAYNKVNEELANAQAANAELQKKLQPFEASAAAATANVDVLAVAAFKTSGNFATLSVILGSQSSDSLIDQLSTLQQINKHQQSEIGALKVAKAQLADEQKKIDDTIAAENAKKADLEVQKKKIEGDVKKLEDLKRRASAAGSTKTAAATKPAGPPPAVSGVAGKAVTFAWNQIGKPYKWGAAGPGSYDCSGLTLASWKAAGTGIPRIAQDQYKGTARVSQADAAPGDLVFFGSSTDKITHVGLYIGGGEMIHAPTTGKTVQKSSINRSNLRGFGRVKVVA